MSMIDEKETVEDVREAGLFCPQCEASNLPQRKFCAKCGAALWEACFHCGEVCAAGESYCGACGVNLADAAAEQLERAQDDLRAAAEMRAACRFADAIALLAPIAENRHPRLARYAAHAEQLVRQLAAEGDRRRIVTDEALRRAGERFQAFDYEEASRILEQVPPPCRNQNVEELYAQVAERREEIATLDRELREAVREKRLFDLPPRIERMLALKPDHVYAKQLAEQVWSRVGDAVEKRLAEHRHDEALQLVDRVSPNCRSPRLQELRRQAAELAWLSFDLRNAPVVDATLAAVAKRVRQLTPDDARTVRHCEEVQRRAAQAEAQGQGTPVLWARPPKETPLGVAVEGLAAFRRITCADLAAADSELRRCPGRFAVACGLALAGLKRATLRVNLLASEQRGVLSRASRIMRSHGDRPAWGLDLGMSGLKAVKLSWNGAARQATVEAAVLIEHAKSLGNALNEAEEQKLIAETLSKFLERHRLKGERICVGLPSRMALVRQFELPPVEQSKIPKLLEFEARQQFPFPLDQLAWDYQFLDETDGDGNVAKNRPGKRWRNVLLLGSQAASSRRFIESFRRQKILVDMLQADFVALHNFLAYEYFSPSGDSPAADAFSAVAAVDVGCNVTNLVVSSPQSLWFRSCGVAGHSFTRALVTQFKLSVAQAEQRKRSPESAERFSDVYEAMSPVFDDLLNELRQALAAYAIAQPDRTLQRVVGVGGGFSLHGLLRWLWHGR
jgi:type IV pilus assembly protein PilM